MECEKFIDCSAYPLAQCPDNADCGTCTDNWNKTTYKFNKCNSGYKGQSGACVCEKVCSDTFTGAIPANATATKEICEACGVYTEIVTGFTCNDGYVKVDNIFKPAHNTCAAANPDYLSAPKANAKCSTTTIYQSNGSTLTCYYNCKCNTEYTEQAGQCVCAKTCKDKITSKPDNSSFVTENCVACGVSSTIKTDWTCNSGYHKSENACECDKTCNHQITTKPANSSFTTTTCSACGKNYTINTGWTCNSGYTKIGNSCEKIIDCSSHTLSACPSNAVCSLCTSNYGVNIGKTTYKFETCANNYTLKNGICVCATTCSDRAGELPVNATYTTAVCTACGVSSTIKTGWTCDTGYVKYNNDCVCPAGTHPTKSQCESAYAYSNCTLDVKCYKPTSCKPGYAVTANHCGSTAAGYSLGLSDNAGCRQCIKNSCPTISVTYTPYGSHTSSISVQTSTDSNAENCGSSGSKGYTSEITSYFSGEARCYACKPKTCPSGYIAGSTQCDVTQEAVTHPGVMSGDKPCTTCIKKIICRIGTYETRSECQRYNIGASCIQLANGCWEPIEMCHYTLDSCHTGGICNSCTTKSGQTKYNLTGCRTNYYMENNYCVSCAAVASTYREYNALAKMTYLNCCGRNYCRKSPCTTSKNGSWTDGCLPLHISMESFESDVYEYRRACQENMQDLYDRIADFNSKCPNHAVSNLFSPYNQCSSVSINGRLARPSDNNIHGC